MLRMVLAFATLLLLSGCWYSDKALFAAEEFANVGFHGEYSGGGSYFGGRFAFERAEDGFYIVRNTEEMTVGDTRRRTIPAGTPADNPFALVPLPHRPDHYLVVKRENNDRGYEYGVARAGPDGIDIYVPDCDGTLASTGISVQPYGKGCRFDDRNAVMVSAERVVDWLDEKHPVMQMPHYQLTRIPAPAEQSAIRESDSINFTIGGDSK